MAHTQEFTAKQRVTGRYNTRVIPREMKERDIMLKKMVEPTRIGQWYTSRGDKCSIVGEVSPAPLFAEWILRNEPYNWSFFFGLVSRPKQLLKHK